MTTPAPNGLHPNLARIAAAYDSILLQMERQQITVPGARAKIAQLEARDDQGTIWSIDPDSGAFVRKTAFGDMEFDTPPTYGVRTEDAFDYSTNPLVENPNHRLSHTQVQLTTPPTSLAGATQRMGPQKPSMAPGGILDRIVELPTAAKAGAAAALVVLLSVVFITTGKDDKAAPPAPASTATTAPVKQAPAKKAPAKPAPKATVKK